MSKIKHFIAETRVEMLLFFGIVAMVAFCTGLSDAVFSNYFKDAYDVNATQRAFLEFPRELPGALCVLVIGGLSFLGDIRLGFIAQLFGLVGITVLGWVTPSYSVMMIFLFTSSMGVHLFMPLSDSIGMALAEPGQVGRRVGQYGSIKTAVGFLTGILVFIGFRMGWFSFKTDVKLPFVFAGVGYLIAAMLVVCLMRATKGHKSFTTKRKVMFAFRKEYRYYYILTTLQGVQKQIALVFGSWVVIDLLLKGADIMSLLVIGASFAGIFFFRFLGRWIDGRGIKFMLYLDALSFIGVYLVYGTVVWIVASHLDAIKPWMVLMIYLLFILDRLSMQIGVIKSVYLRSIAVSQEDVTAALSTGISIDHVVTIIAAQVSGFIWTQFGPQWVFYFAAVLSVGNLLVARRIKEPAKTQANA